MSDYEIGSIVPLTEDSKDARFAHALKSLNAIITERDQLRAELAAAKNLLARIHRDGGHYTQAVGVAQSIADADGKVSEWLLLVNEREALAADNARLRAALEEVRDRALPLGLDRGDSVTQLIAEQALAATPAQSMAANTAGQETEDAFEFTKGHEYTDDLPVAGIHVRGANGWHGNKIEVYGDSAVMLRDRILALLTTPAQALAAHDAAVKVAVLLVVAEKLRLEESTNSSRHAEFVEAEADRIKREAQRG